MIVYSATKARFKKDVLTNDIEAALEFDITTLTDRPGYLEMTQLFEEFKEAYRKED